MTFRPTTLPEWKKYISSLRGEALRSKAIAANSLRFVQTLQGEGYSPDDIYAIHVLFAKQFLRTGQEPPSNGYVNYQKLARGED